MQPGLAPRRPSIVEVSSVYPQDRTAPRSMSDLSQLIGREQIDLILTVAERKSFKAAAAALGITQPTVSQRVARLEGLAGHVLFLRTRGGVELTREGRAVVSYGKAMLALTNDLERHLEHIMKPARISVGMSEDFCRTALPSVLWLFMRDYPQVDVRIISGTYETLKSAVDSNMVDFAIMRRYEAFPISTLLWTDSLVWVGSPNFSLPVHDPVPLVVPVSPNPARDAPIAALLACGRSWDIRFESVGIAGIEAALEAGVGLCASPQTMRIHGVSQLSNDSGLPDLPTVDFVMVGPGHDATAVVHAFSQVLQQAAREGFQHMGPSEGSF